MICVISYSGPELLSSHIACVLSPYQRSGLTESLCASYTGNNIISHMPRIIFDFWKCCVNKAELYMIFCPVPCTKKEKNIYITSYKVYVVLEITQASCLLCLCTTHKSAVEGAMWLTSCWHWLKCKINNSPAHASRLANRILLFSGTYLTYHFLEKLKILVLHRKYLIRHYLQSSMMAPQEWNKNQQQMSILYASTADCVAEITEVVYNSTWTPFLQETNSINAHVVVFHRWACYRIVMKGNSSKLQQFW